MEAAVVDKKIYDHLLDKHEQLQLAHVSLQQQVLQLQKMIFGSKHERFVPSESNPSQLALELQAEATATCSVVDAKKITYVKTNTSVEQKPLVHPGRMKR